LNKAATRVTGGAISLSSSTHLPACVGSVTAKPVALHARSREAHDEAA
jgi:hypothetical protein